MKHLLFTVWDAKSMTYSLPIPAITQAEGKRKFATAVRDPKSALNMWPEDYTFFELGVWDDNDATITLYKTPLSLGLAIQYLVEAEPAVQQLRADYEAEQKLNDSQDILTLETEEK